jgi:hypothetical protein
VLSSRVRLGEGSALRGCDADDDSVERMCTFVYVGLSEPEPEPDDDFRRGRAPGPTFGELVDRERLGELRGSISGEGVSVNVGPA